MTFSMGEFNKDREEMLLSLDVDKMRAFCTKYGVPLPSNDPTVLLGSIHKARTALKTLPREERIKSKAWLEERGWHSLDDGDLEER